MTATATATATDSANAADTAMSTLCTDPNLEAPDDFYEALIETFQGLTSEQSHALNARLVLLLANHIGRQSVLLQALATARVD